MSLIFEHQGKTAWNPSSRAGNLFLAQVRAIESVLGISSGFSPPLNDEVQVDIHQLRDFSLHLAGEISAGNSPTLQTLVCAVFALAAGIYAACNTSPLDGLKGQCLALQRYGEVLVSGQYNPGPIYHGGFK